MGRGRGCPYPSMVDPLQLLSLVTRNLVPLGGALFLGWSVTGLLVLYFIDTLLAIAALLWLVMAHITGMGEGKGMPSRWLDWINLALGALFGAALFALPLGIPLYILLEQVGTGYAALLADPAFRTGLGFQMLASLQMLLGAHRELKQRDDDDAYLKRRVQFVIGRWVVVIMAAMTGFPGLLGPYLGGLILLLVYAVASVYMELFPERVEAWLTPRKAVSSPSVHGASRKTGRKGRNRRG